MTDTVSTSVAIPIKTVTLTGDVSQPVKLQAPASTVSTGNDNVNVALTWDPALPTTGDFAGKFEVNKAYTATLTVSAATGATLATDVAVTFPSGFTVSDANPLVATKTFPATADKELTGLTAVLKDTTKTYQHGDTVGNTDFTATAAYDDGSNADVTAASTVTYPNGGTALAKGDTSVTVSYTEGGVTKTAPLAVTVNAKAITVNVADIDDVTYTGTEIKPAPAVTSASATLTEGTDYTYSYANNTNAAKKTDTSAPTVTVSPVSSSNYTFTEVTKNFTINPVDCTYSVSDQEIKVGSGLSAINAPAAAAGVNSESVPGTVAWYTDTGYATAAADTDLSGLTVGDTKTLYWKFTPNGDNKGNYKEQTGSAVFTIVKGAPQVLTFDQPTVDAKTYSSETFTNKIVKVESNGQTITDNGAITYASSNGSVATVDANGTVTLKGPGTATITATAAAVSGKYAKGEASYTLTVNKAPLTITGVTANNRPYDGTAAATLNTDSADLSGVVGSDVVSLDTTTSATAVFADKNVGTDKAVTITAGFTLSGTDAGKYELTQPTGLTADITAKGVTITNVTASNKTYDGNVTATLNTGSAELNGVVSGDDVTPNYSAVFADKNVGSDKPVTTSITLTGADAGNYTLTQPTGLTAAITAKDVTITGLSASDKTYDGTTAATLTGTPTISGLETVDASTVSVTDGTAAFDSKDVGTSVAVTCTGFSLSGADAGNYNLTAQPTVAAAAITAKDVTITGLSASDKTYDGTTAATLTGTPTISGLETVDASTVSVTDGTAAFDSKDVGTSVAVTCTGFSLSGTDAGNYNLTAQPTVAAADITAKGVTITGLSASDKTYDGTTAATLTGTPTISGLETVDASTVSVTDGTAAFDSKDVGTSVAVTCTGFSLSGTDAGNYNLTAQPTVAAAAITAANYTAPTVTTPQDVLEGDNVAVPAGAAGVNGETLTGSFAFYSNAECTTAVDVTIIEAADPATPTTLYWMFTPEANEVSANYDTTPATGGTITITVISGQPQQLTFTMAGDVTKTYGDAAFSNPIKSVKSGTTDLTRQAKSSITYSSDNEDVATVDANGKVTIVGVGTANIKATSPKATYGGIQYAPKTESYQVTVNAKNANAARSGVTAKLTSGALTYDGNPQTPTLLVKDGNKTLTAVTDYNVTYKGDSYSESATAPTDAGSYTAVVNFTGNYTGTLEVPFTIAKANASCTAPTPAEGLTYTGADLALLTAGCTTDPTCTVKYSLDRNTWDTAFPTGNAADSYTVYYKAFGNDNYNDSPLGNVTVTIAKTAPVMGTAPAAVSGLVYNGTAQTLITAGTSPDGTLQYALGTDATTVPAASAFKTALPTGTNAGTYYVWSKIVGDSDHSDLVLAAPVTVTIAKADRSLQANGSATPADMNLFPADSLKGVVNLTYDDADKSAVVAVTGVTGVSMSVSGKAYTFTGVSSGNCAATVTFSIAATENYNAATDVSVKLNVYKDVIQSADGAFTGAVSDSLTTSVTGSDRLVVSGVMADPTALTFDNTQVVYATAPTALTGLTAAYASGKVTVTDASDKTVAVYNVDTSGITQANITVQDAAAQLDASVGTAGVSAIASNGLANQSAKEVAGKSNVESGDTVNAFVEASNASYDATAGQMAMDIDFKYEVAGGAPTDTGSIQKPAAPVKVTATMAGAATSFVPTMARIVDSSNRTQYVEVTQTAPSQFSWDQSVPGTVTLLTAAQTRTGTINYYADTAKTKLVSTVTYTDTDVGVTKFPAYSATGFQGWTINGTTYKVTDTMTDGLLTALDAATGQTLDATANIKSGTGGGGTGGGGTGGGGDAAPAENPVNVTPASSGSTASHAKVTSSASNAKAGDKVNLTVTADEGYQVDGVKVTDAKGKDVPVTKNTDGTYSFVMPDSAVSVEPVVSEAPPAGTNSVRIPTTSAKAKVASSASYAKPGDTVDLTVTPDAGYQVDGVKVTDANGNEVPVTKNADGTYSFVMPDSAVSVEPVVSAAAATSSRFSDVPADAYYADAVDWAVDKGITTGTSDTTFSPNDPCTRGQMVTFLWRLAGQPAPTGSSNPFTDVKEDAYYYDAVLWAVEKGITLGTSATAFSPNDTVNRAQTATFLYRYLQSNGGGFTGAWAFPLNYADAADVPEYAYEAFCYWTMQGVIQGADNNMLRPLDDCLRGQIVTMMYRAFQ